jgi:hypothetical protein
MEQKRKKTRIGKQLKGRYANYFEIGHNAFQFLLDFGESYAENARARLHTRIITAPTYANVLLETLRTSIDHYEQTFGTIPKHEEQKTEVES